MQMYAISKHVRHVEVADVESQQLLARLLVLHICKVAKLDINNAG